MSEQRRSVGYAVVGLGWISQAAMLPAFGNARRNSHLTALVSGDERKRRLLADRYDLPADATFDYDAYDACLERDDVTAVYIAVPNHLHRDYVLRAAEKGVHVLCEKPLGVTADECREMIDACRVNGVKLMTAYRLHFDPANMGAVERAEAGAIGATRVFNATFTQQVDEGDIRLAPAEKGGGPLYDIGIYCINAARYLFRAEPDAVWGLRASLPQRRFGDVEEMVSCVLRFPEERLAAFTCSFGAAAVSTFHLVGTEGEIRLENAFNFTGDRQLAVSGERAERETYPEVDQFGSQLLYFSDCVLQDQDPEPDGEEGLVDVRIIEALNASLDSGDVVPLRVSRERRPAPDMAMRCPAIEAPELVEADAPGD